jgi:hypothetical protein
MSAAGLLVVFSLVVFSLVVCRAFLAWFFLRRGNMKKVYGHGFPAGIRGAHRRPWIRGAHRRQGRPCASYSRRTLQRAPG